VEKYGRARQNTDDNINGRMRFAFRVTEATYKLPTAKMVIEFYIFRATDITKLVTYQQTAQQISLIHIKRKLFQHSSPISYSYNQGAMT
jgi:hypothetical protein